MSAKNDTCPCDSGRPFSACCAPYVSGESAAPTAEALMRSRYTAYALQNADYLLRTWHPATAPRDLSLSPEQRWLGLTVRSTEAGGETDDAGEVSFVARYKLHGKGHRLEERSEFTRIRGHWVYVGAIIGG